MSFAELHCLSNFSFLRGASRPEELVAQAFFHGYDAIALTDECSLAGIVKAHVAARELGIKLIIGTELVIDAPVERPNTPEKPTRGRRKKTPPIAEAPPAPRYHLVLLASNRQAYGEISLLITKARRRSPKGEYRVELSDLQFGTRHCLAIWLPQTIGDNSDLNQHQQQAALLKSYFRQRLWIGVELLQTGQDSRHYQHCYTLAKDHDISMVACNDVHMHGPERQQLQDVLTAVRHKMPIQQLGQLRFCNGERHLRPLDTLRNIYPEELLQESLNIAELCQFSLEELRHDYPEELVPKGKTSSQYLCELSLAGAERRWPNGTPPKVADQLENELRLIEELHYEHYFLTVADIVHFARSQKILCQGRGSAANSVVCYCLFITEVDPAQSALLFERFISKERNEPPDIDVDFEHERREEVIQYIYQKYTRKRAALTATVITYRPKSAIRDVGKALDFDPLLIERLSKDLTWWEKSNHLEERLQAQGIAGSSRMAQQFLFLIREILGFPRHLSQHVGGFLITQTPISNLVPVENASMADRTIIQWDKEDIESLGLLKVDVLALGMLTAIRKTLALINSYQTPPTTVANIPKEDPQTYAMLCRGDSVGVFQVESRAQMAMLPRLKPRCYYDLVVEVAIVRPGPIQGDMVHPYLKRRDGEEAVTYPNDEIKEVLERTLGIPIFQEQVIKLAMVAAGFSGGEADQLRRAMASWGRNGNLHGFKQKLIDGMLARGHSQDFADRLFRQMQGFGEYGFPESHAASFALLVYTSAWLKCHYPAAFYCGLLNSLPMGFYSASQLVQDARRHKIEVRPIDIRYSQWDHTLELIEDDVLLEQQPALRLGLRIVKSFNQQAAERIQDTKNSYPDAINDLAELARRANLNNHELECLAGADALGHLSEHRRDSHWQVQSLATNTELLPSEVHQENASIQLDAPDDGESTLEDYIHTGLTLNKHPMELLRGQPPFNQCSRAVDLFKIRHGRFVKISGVVTGRQRPGTASGVLFITLEDETGNCNIVVWKTLQAHCRQAVLKARIMLIKGTLERKDNVIHVIAGHIEDMSDRMVGFGMKSRDFH